MIAREKHNNMYLTNGITVKFFIGRITLADNAARIRIFDYDLCLRAFIYNNRYG